MAENKSSNTDTIVKIVLVFFISLLSFSIGTFVGKKFSDNQHRLSSMEPQKNEHATAKSESHANNHAEGNHEEGLNDEQVSALASEFVDDENGNTAEHKDGKESKEGHKGEHKEVAKHEEKNAHESEAANESEHRAPASEKEKEQEKEHSAEAKEPTSHEATGHDKKGHEVATHEEHAKESTKHEAVKHEAAKHEAPKSEAAVHEKTIEASATKEMAKSAAGKFTIQIASYPSEEEAQKRINDLKKLNFEAFYTPATIKGQTWYRVNVGTFATAKEAQEHKTELTEKTHINTAIIQKLVK